VGAQARGSAGSPQLAPGDPVQLRVEGTEERVSRGPIASFDGANQRWNVGVHVIWERDASVAYLENSVKMRAGKSCGCRGRMAACSS
jgi:hypothetical protein